MQFNTLILLALSLANGYAASVTPLPQLEGPKFQTLDSTTHVTHHNCGGKWGVYTDNAVVQKEVNRLGSSSATSCQGGKTSISVSKPACDHGVRFKSSNTDSKKKCLADQELADRALYIANNCNKEGTYTGQVFYKDGSNFIIETC